MAKAARSGQFDIVVYAPYIDFDLCRGPISIIDKDAYTEAFFIGKKMSLWVRLLVILPFLVFAGISLFFVIQGDSKAAAGGLVIAALISPLLIEVIWPGKYGLRKPDDEVSDNLLNRLRQFRIDHPGADGTFFLLIFAFLGVALLAGALARLTHSLGIR